MILEAASGLFFLPIRPMDPPDPPCVKLRLTREDDPRSGVRTVKLRLRKEEVASFLSANNVNVVMRRWNLWYEISPANQVGMNPINTILLNILYPQQTNRTLPAVLDSCTFYFCLALSIYKLSYFLLLVWLLKLLHLLSSVLLHTFEYTILFSLHFSVLHNLSWYQSYNSKPLHTVGRATRSSQRRASRILRARVTDFSQGLESCLHYSLKITVRS